MENIPEFIKKRITSASVIEVIEIKTIIGEGTNEDPVREQFEYWTKEGKLIGKSFGN